MESPVNPLTEIPQGEENRRILRLIEKYQTSKIDKINLERFGDFYEAMVESGKEMFSAGFPDLSRNEWEHIIKAYIALWDQDNTYAFYVLDGMKNQMVGMALLNQIYRLHQIGNLAYIVRTTNRRRNCNRSQSLLPSMGLRNWVFNVSRL